MSRRPRLALEPLEDRLLPVVGFSTIPAPVGTGNGFDGVVKLSAPPGDGTGTLLTTGRHILTAAHVVDSDADKVADGAVDVLFEMPAGNVTITVPAKNITIQPTWLGENNIERGGDLAILELPELAPSGAAGADRFDIYRNTDEVGKEFTFVGYGKTGVGSTGATGAAGVKRLGMNRFDVTSGLDQNMLGFDFDNGNILNNAFNLEGAFDLGLGSAEADTAPGDSGGPSFIDGKIAGVTSFGRGFFILPDVLADVNSSFGEQAFNTRVSSFADFIDSTIGGDYDLVIDLKSQEAGNDGARDTIAVALSGNSIEVSVNGQLLHRDLLSRIDSITLRGSSDDEVFQISANLGIAVDVSADLGTNELILTGTSSADTVTVTSSFVTLGSQRIDFAGIQKLTVDARGGDDTISIQSTAAVTLVTIQGGDGLDTLVAPDRINTITIDNDNAGALNAGVTFTSVENLRGGTSDDTFVFGNTVIQSTIILNGQPRTINVVRLAGLSGTIDGNSGTDTLDYTASNLGVKIDLSARTATATGSVTGIENVTGSTRGDLIRGNSGRNVLRGNGGNDILVGNDGNDTLYAGNDRSLLIGGSGQDILQGGTADDLLIGDGTVYDNNDDALFAILDVWRSNQTYDQRVQAIQNSAGTVGGRTVRLDSRAIIADRMTDRLTGSEGMDWFWILASDILVDLRAGERSSK